MASQNMRKPVLAGTGSADYLNRGEAFDTAEYSANLQQQQAPRIVIYTVNSNLFVEVRHAV